MLVISLLFLASGASAARYPPHCVAGDPCWPADVSWARLNSTLHGRLVRSLPPAAPCHIPNYDEVACAAVKANWASASWRARQPGAYQDTAWENGDEPCYVDGPQNATCRQGLVPYYTAVVLSVEDIQAAVIFAKDNHLRTRIKGASHDFLGKSSGKGSFGIQTIHMKGITFKDSFVPTACNVPAQKAVSVAAGELFSDLYKATDARGVTIVGGGCTSVGAAGGWALGGGHSHLTPLYGLGVDNILQFSVVTADGRARVVNQCQNPDLFWALRGGGGGFAVVTSVTYKTHPAIESTNIVLVSFRATPELFTSALSKYLGFQTKAADAGFFTSSVILPSAGMVLGAYVLSNSDDSAASTNSTFDPLFQFAAEHPNQVTVTTTAMALKSQLSVVHQIVPEGMPQGTISIWGSRLFPRSAFEGDEKNQKLAKFLSTATMPDSSIVLMIMGGKVNEVAPSATAVNPSWRTMFGHIMIERKWSSDTNISDRNAIRKDLTQKTQELAQFVPDMGAYMNEADAGEPEWQKTFWGDNYPRLLAIKSKYDPSGVLTCRKCVGDDIFGS
ncbi:hypothetical protein BOTBODRAFT_190389 [Botryobasidium botryosum FD-172 SS1]|uniref:FAD-binding PCMH-type domain-containing protein n=1 Tax=Botryobasidium botryosum (strain FD-172 SS1) TaxID=930990 RepID=A0A067M4Q9_BOTB1|nr:hypothetical protein BOTBODRAFT_190389 [Botryobasidium botryosum FD-172 SS1]